MEKQPAYKSYILVLWPKHLKEIFLSAVKNLQHRASSLLSEDFPEFLSYAAAAGTVLVGFLIAAVLTIVHGATLLIVSLVAYLILVTIYVSDLLYRRLKHWSFVCPYCRSRFGLPGYLCPTCGERHTSLIPSIYGILRRKCKCGKTLPTTSFNGRDDLTPFCPSCGKLLNPEFNKTSPVVISVVGSVGAGKTTLILLLADALIEKAEKLRWSWKIVKASDKNLITELKELRKGKFPRKTASKIPPAFNIKLTSPAADAYLIYLFDYSGEAFNEISTITSFHEHSYVDAILIVLDPSQPDSSENAISNFLTSLEARGIEIDKAAIILTKSWGNPKKLIEEKFTGLWNSLKATKVIKELLLFSFDLNRGRKAGTDKLIVVLGKLLIGSRNEVARKFTQRLLNARG